MVITQKLANDLGKPRKEQFFLLDRSDCPCYLRNGFELPGTTLVLDIRDCQFCRAFFDKIFETLIEFH